MTPAARAALDEFRRPDGQFGEQHRVEDTNFTPPPTGAGSDVKAPASPDDDPEVLDHDDWFDPADGGATVTYLALSRTAEGNVAVDIDIEEGLDWHARHHFGHLDDVVWSEPVPGTGQLREEAFNEWVERHSEAVAANLRDVYDAAVDIDGEGEHQRARMSFRLDTGMPDPSSIDLTNTAFDKWAHVTNTTDPGTFGRPYLFGEAFSRLAGQAVLGARYGDPASADQATGERLEADAIAAAGELVGGNADDDYLLLAALANRSREGISLDGLRAELARGQERVGLADRFGRVAAWVDHRAATKDADRPW